MAPDAFAVSGFDDYAAKLRRAKVMLDAGEREAAIRQEAANLAFARGWEIVADDGLADRGRGPCRMARAPDGRHRGRFLSAAARGAANLDEGTSEVLLGPQSQNRPDRGLCHRRQYRNPR
jgi:hypothetical protein